MRLPAQLEQGLGKELEPSCSVVQLQWNIWAAAAPQPPQSAALHRAASEALGASPPWLPVQVH